ncbi:hypothetical protein TYRP_022518 [Tyrophagus putrescentiae]|nr:hypothetical protein TYRP_022518 [Tyrophagus putrescentiae]
MAAEVLGDRVKVITKTRNHQLTPFSEPENDRLLGLLDVPTWKGVAPSQEKDCIVYLQKLFFREVLEAISAAHKNHIKLPIDPPQCPAHSSYQRTKQKSCHANGPVAEDGTPHQQRKTVYKEGDVGDVALRGNQPRQKDAQKSAPVGGDVIALFANGDQTAVEGEVLPPDAQCIAVMQRIEEEKKEAISR